jgi:pimeloyl-ACP methyl ester carboxylesterase
MVRERAVEAPDGRTLVVHDAGPAGEAGTVVWHHGSPQSGALLAPLVAATEARGLRLVSYGRPSYGGSTSRPGRDVASAGDDVDAIADALGIDRFATMGASGGGPHALACAAALGDRVTGVVCLASVAPYDAADPAWFDGMADPGGLQAAIRGRAARAAYAETDEFDPASFTAADQAALADRWSSLATDAGAAGQAWPDGLIDDDVALVAPWGFALAGVTAPVLLVQGGEDRVVPRHHADRLLRALAHAELWLRPRDGHVSVLDACPVALDWLLAVSG